jgi:hypothetical protein
VNVPDALALFTEELGYEGINRGFDFYIAALKRILVFEAYSSQAHRRGFARTIFLRSVHRITHNRQAGVSEVDANLMSAAGEGARFNQRETVFAIQHFEHRFSLFAVRIGPMAAVFLWIGAEFHIAKPFLFLWNSADNSKIAFVHFSGFEEVAVGF